MSPAKPTTCCPSTISDRPSGPPMAIGNAARSTPAIQECTNKSTQDTLIYLPGGLFDMGSDADEGEPADGEGPKRSVHLSAFEISAHAVSNHEFAAFVEATDYLTYAQEVGNSFVFAGLLPADFPETHAVADSPWWRVVMHANWRNPEGPGSSIDTRMDHPVVHVCWHDAIAYCQWAGQRLPTEAEWEYAARGGLVGQRFPWGDELTPQGEHRCNIWQGRFPVENSLSDTYYGTAPVNTFAPNGFGLYNTCGNVWEWCADWFTNQHIPTLTQNPQGPAIGQGRVIRGGSFLCEMSYCYRYRVCARSSNDPWASTSHQGFRTARSLKQS